MWYQLALLFGKLAAVGLAEVSVSLWADTERVNPHLLFAPSASKLKKQTCSSLLLPLAATIAPHDQLLPAEL